MEEKIFTAKSDLVRSSVCSQSIQSRLTLTRWTVYMTQLMPAVTRSTSSAQFDTPEPGTHVSHPKPGGFICCERDLTIPSSFGTVRARQTRQDKTVLSASRLAWRCDLALSLHKQIYRAPEIIKLIRGAEALDGESGRE